MAVSWLKWKHRKPKPIGRFHAREGTQAGKRNKHKSGDTQKSPRQRVMVVGPFGRRRFEWRDW